MTGATRFWNGIDFSRKMCEEQFCSRSRKRN